jgi:hypothetical protein
LPLRRKLPLHDIKMFGKSIAIGRVDSFASGNSKNTVKKIPFETN